MKLEKIDPASIYNLQLANNLTLVGLVERRPYLTQTKAGKPLLSVVLIQTLNDNENEREYKKTYATAVYDEKVMQEINQVNEQFYCKLHCFFTCYSKKHPNGGFTRDIAITVWKVEFLGGTGKRLLERDEINEQKKLQSI